MTKTTNNNYIASLVNNNNGKISTLKKHLNQSSKARKQFNYLSQIAGLQDDNKNLFDIISNYDNNLYQVGSIITVHSLKVLAKGRRYTDKNGDIKFTPSNDIAYKILYQQENTSISFEDLLQDVITALYECISNKTISINTDTMQIEGEEEQRKQIFNTVQNRLYSLQEKHYSHLYTPSYTVNDNGEEEETDGEMYKLSQRAYNLSINNIDYDGIVNSLSVKLTTDEQKVLKISLQTKQVVRSYSDNGISKNRYVTRQLTLTEKADATGLSVQNIRTILIRLQTKLQNYLHDTKISTAINDHITPSTTYIDIDYSAIACSAWLASRDVYNHR